MKTRKHVWARVLLIASVGAAVVLMPTASAGGIQFKDDRDGVCGSGWQPWPWYPVGSNPDKNANGLVCMRGSPI